MESLTGCPKDCQMVPLKLLVVAIEWQSSGIGSDYWKESCWAFPMAAQTDYQ